MKYTYHRRAKNAIDIERNDMERQINGKKNTINKVPRAPFTK